MNSREPDCAGRGWCLRIFLTRFFSYYGGGGGISKPYFGKQWDKISVKMGRHIRAAGDQRRCHQSLEGWGEFGEEVVGGDSEKRYKRCA